MQDAEEWKLMWEKLGDKNFKATILSTDYDRLKNLKNVEYFNCFGRMITNNVSPTREIKFRIFTTKAAFKKDKPLFASKVDLNLRSKVPKWYIRSVTLHGPECWTLHRADQIYLENFKMCWRRMGKIILSCRVKKLKYFIRSKLRGTSYIKYKGRRVTGLATACVATAFWTTCSLKLFVLDCHFWRSSYCKARGCPIRSQPGHSTAKLPCHSAKMWSLLRPIC